MTTDEPAEDDGEWSATGHLAAFDAAVAATPHLPRDRAAVHLARTYAGVLDDAFDRIQEYAEGDDEESRSFARVVSIIAKIGPRYEAVLDKLGMTPGARPAVRGESTGDDPAATALSGLQAAAAGAAAGFDPTAFVDPAVTGADAGD